MSEMKGYEDWAVVGYRAPIDGNASAATVPSTTTGIDMSLWSEVLIIIECGVIATGGTSTNVVSDSATTNGTYAAVAGKSKSTDDVDDGKIYIIAVAAAELNAGARFLRLVQTPSAHSSLGAIVALGKAVINPATDNKLAAQQTVVD